MRQNNVYKTKSQGKKKEPQKRTKREAKTTEISAEKNLTLVNFDSAPSNRETLNPLDWNAKPTINTRFEWTQFKEETASGKDRFRHVGQRPDPTVFEILPECASLGKKDEQKVVVM